MMNKELKLKAEELRLKLIKLIYSSGTGHTGGDLSVLNVLVSLYNRILNVDPKDLQNPDRDRFILSKGHCA
ncbi:MAG: transketolase, partial [Bacteroidaceae bacterium]